MPDIQEYEPLWGAWHVESMIGQGAFGQVYKVCREDFGKTYFSAVKIISVPLDSIEIRQMKSEGLSGASIRDFFHALAEDILKEITLMSELRGNSHIVSIEDHQIIQHGDGIGWDILLRMELLQSLAEHVAGKQMSTAEIVRMGIHICRALELCAQKKIIHRDIKPDNIFLSPHGDFKLGDFGIARNIERTMSGMSRKGSYTTMAPEVFRGEKYGLSVDSYALGIVMYSLLNQNRVPFLPDYPQAIMPEDRDNALEKRMSGETLPPLKNIGPKLNGAVLKACAYHRSDRFDTPAQMRQALETVIGIGSIPAEVEAEPIPPEGARSQRNPVSQTDPISQTDQDLTEKIETGAPPLAAADPRQDTPHLPENTGPTLRHPKPAIKIKRIALLSAWGVLTVTALIVLFVWLAQSHSGPFHLAGTPGSSQTDEQGETATPSSDAEETLPDDAGDNPDASDVASSENTPSESSAQAGTSLASDKFDRAAETRGFGQASQGGLWQPAATSRMFSTDGRRAVLTVDAVGWMCHARLTDVNQADIDVMVSIGVPQLPAAGTLRPWVSARITKNFDAYLLRVNISSDGRVESLELMKMTGATGDLLYKVPTSITLTSGEEVTLRLRVVGSSLQGKAWKTGTPEPENWACSFTDTSFTGAGSVGIGAYIGQLIEPLPVKVTFDNFVATSR